MKSLYIEVSGETMEVPLNCISLSDISDSFPEVCYNTAFKNKNLNKEAAEGNIESVISSGMPIQLIITTNDEKLVKALSETQSIHFYSYFICCVVDNNKGVWTFIYYKF